MDCGYYCTWQVITHATVYSPFQESLTHFNKAKEWWAWADSIMWQDPSSGRIYPKLNVAVNGSTTEVECDKAINATSEDSFQKEWDSQNKLDGH